MTTYNWTIAQLERQTDTGGVIVAHWRCTAEDGEYASTAYGTAGFTPDATSPDFKPYDQVTEAEVLGWCWSNGVDKDATEANLAAQIEADKHPTTANGVPWA